MNARPFSVRLTCWGRGSARGSDRRYFLAIVGFCRPTAGFSGRRYAPLLNLSVRRIERRSDECL